MQGQTGMNARRRIYMDHTLNNFHPLGFDMRRDMNLVREILIRLEPLKVHAGKPQDVGIGKPPLDIDGYSQEQIAYHLRLMSQGDLINIMASQRMKLRCKVSSA